MIDIATLGLEIRSDGVLVASDRLRAMRDEGEKAEGVTGKLGRAYDSLAGYIKAAAAAYGVMKMAEYIKDATLLAARAETLGVTMKVVGMNAGYTSAEMLKAEESVRKMGIATIEARESLTKMAGAQMDVGKASQLARVAQDAAVIGGINSSEAFARMIQGIRSGETEVLKTIGINVSFEQSYAKFADSVGKSKEQLTEHEKVLARQNAVMEYGTNIAGAYEAAMGTTGKQITSLKRYYDDLKVAFGDAFNPALGVMVEGLTASLKYMAEWFVSNKSALKELATNLKDIAKALIDAAKHPLTTAGKFLNAPFSGRNYYDEAGNQDVNDNAAQTRSEDERDATMKEMAFKSRADQARAAAAKAERERLAEQVAEKSRAHYNSFAEAFNSRLSGVDEKDPLLSKQEQEILKVKDAYAKLRENFPEYKKDLNDLERYELQEVKALQDWTQGLKDLATQQEIFDGMKTVDSYWNSARADSSQMQNNLPDPLAEQFAAQEELRRINASMKTSITGDASDEQIQAAQDLYDKRLEQLDKFHSQGLIQQKQYDDALILATQEREKRLSDIEKVRQNAALSATGQFLGEMGRTLMQGGKEQFEQGKKLAIASALINTYLAASNAFASGTKTHWAVGVALAAAAIAQGMAQVSSISSQQYGVRALGGAVDAGKPYMIGERGAELFTPSTNGTITPAHKVDSGQAAPPVTNVFQISTGVVDTVRAEIGRLLPAITEMSVGAVRSAMRQGEFA